MNDKKDLEEFNQLAGADVKETTDFDDWDDEPEISSQEEDFGTKEKNGRMWAVSGNAFTSCEKAVATLPPGQFTVEHDHQRGIYFSQKEINIDGLLTLPDSASTDVIKSIEHFWKKKEKFQSHGFLWKRGVLLWGPPGGGKTCVLQILSELIIKRGGLSVYVSHPRLAAEGLEILRRIEPDRPIVAMIEDVDAVVKQHSEANLLALLDGELQINNIVFIATTNYPQRLDSRIINRPSRFDFIKKIGMPSIEARQFYIKAKNSRLEKDPVELKKWVEKTEGFSIAHIKELIISVEVLDVDFDEAIERLNTMVRAHLEDDDGLKKNMIGFN